MRVGNRLPSVEIVFAVDSDKLRAVARQGIGVCPGETNELFNPSRFVFADAYYLEM